MIKTKVNIVDRGPGVKRLAETLGGLGQLRLGIEGEKAAEPHPESELMVGEVAAVWELGLVPGQPKRSWLSAWIDANQERMVAEARAALQDVIAERMSRKRAFEKLGYKWALEIRENLANGGVTPPISAATAKLKGHAIPLYDTHAVYNAIGYKIFLPHWKNVPGGNASGAASAALTKTMVGVSPEVGSPQPPDKPGRPRRHGPKENRQHKAARALLAAGMISERQFHLAFAPRRRKGPREKGRQYGPRFDPKKAGKLPKAVKVRLGAVAKVRVKRGPGSPKQTSMRRVSRARARTARGNAHAQMKASWAAKWLKKIARKLIKGHRRQKIHR